MATSSVASAHPGPLLPLGGWVPGQIGEPRWETSTQVRRVAHAGEGEAGSTGVVREQSGAQQSQALGGVGTRERQSLREHRF